MTTPLRVLILEDNPADTRLLVQELGRAGFDPHWRCVDTEGEYLLQLETNPDLILADYSLPQFGALEALRRLRDRRQDIPFIIVSGSIGEELAVAAVRDGATDYLLKDRLGRLGPAVTQALERRRLNRERRQAEEARRSAEALFHNLVEHSLVGIHIIQDGHFAYVNPKLAEVFGYTVDEIFELPSWLDLVADADRPLVAEHVGQRLSGQVPSAHYSFRGRRKDGTVIDVDVHGNRTQLNGRPAVIGTLIDVTDRRRAELLRDGQARILEMIATNAPLAETLTSLARLVESAAPGMVCSVLLLDESGTRIRHGAAPSLPASYTRQIDGLTIGPRAGSCGTAMYFGKPVIVTDILQDPLWKNYRDLAAPLGLRACWSVPVRSHTGQVLGSLAVYYREPRGPLPEELRLLDLATHIAGIAIQRYRAEESLRRAEQKYRSIFEHALEGIFQSTPDGRFLTANPALARIYGYDSPAELIASVTDIERTLYVDPARRAEFQRRIAEQGEVAAFEAKAYRKDRSEVWTLESARAVHDADGTLLFYEGMVEDISARKRAEEALRQAQKMEAVGRLAGGVAHDFRNLMTVINGFSEMALEHLRAGDPLLEPMQQIKRAGDRASALTRQLLALGRKQVLVPVVLDVNAVLAELQKMLPQLLGKDVDLLVCGAAELGRVRADAGQLEQVILNLVVNARDAMPSGGKLTIEAGNTTWDEPTAAEHGGLPAGEYVRLAVSDTGVGIDPAVLGRIFEPFFTTKGPEHGTGLGLAIVYGIIQQSGGYVGVYSEVGLGTTFTIYLPRVYDPVAVAEPAGPPRSQRGSETVLIVEDEDTVRTLTRLVLEKSGYHVLVASNGPEALAVNEQFAGPIHLLVTDVVMPKMSGRQLVERLAPLRPAMKVLYLSGYSDEAVERHGALNPGVPFLQKPYSTEALARRVRELLDQ